MGCRKKIPPHINAQRMCSFCARGEGKRPQQKRAAWVWARELKQMKVAKNVQLQCNISRWRNPAQLFYSSGPGRIGKRRKINTAYTPADQWANVTARDIFFHGERPIKNCNTVLRLFDCWKLFFVDFPPFFLRFLKPRNIFHFSGTEKDGGWTRTPLSPITPCGEVCWPALLIMAPSYVTRTHLPQITLQLVIDQSQSVIKIGILEEKNVEKSFWFYWKKKFQFKKKIFSFFRIFFWSISATE